MPLLALNPLSITIITNKSKTPITGRSYCYPQTERIQLNYLFIKMFWLSFLSWDLVVMGFHCATLMVHHLTSEANYYQTSFVYNYCVNAVPFFIFYIACYQAGPFFCFNTACSQVGHVHWGLNLGHHVATAQKTPKIWQVLMRT